MVRETVSQNETGLVNKKRTMEIILIQDVDNLGAKNEVVKVKNGYARNYLLPRQLAVENETSEKERRQNAG